MNWLKQRLSIVHKLLADKSRHDNSNHLHDLYYIVDAMIRNIDLVESMWNIDENTKKKILSNIPGTFCLWTEEKMEELNINKSIIDEYRDLYN